MWATHGIRFENCTFAPTTPNPHGSGINSIDANSEITKGCNFSNLNQAIYALATAPLWGNMLIGSYVEPTTTADRNTFLNNTNNIYAGTMDKMVVQYNDFDNATPHGYGAWLLNGSQGSVAYNNFNHLEEGVYTVQ